MRPYAAISTIIVVGGASALWSVLAADELSSSDQLHALYSDRFSFTDDGHPLLTVEIMSHQDRVVLHADRVLPNGEGGAEITTGNDRWTVDVVGGRPAKIVEWTVVGRFDHDDGAGIDATTRAWSKRGLELKTFETGTVFGVQGEVIDSREVLVAVDPVPAGRGAARASVIARKYDVPTSVFPEIVRRPQGTLVARNGSGAIVRNDSLLWFAPVKDTATVRVENVVFGTGGSQLTEARREDRRYWGTVYVTLGSDGKLVVANAVPAHKLLDGLVPSEIFADAPAEALNAQSVAARTELLSRIGTRHFTDPFLLCSNQHCQVYSGAGREHPRTTAAVRRTRGQVMLRDGGGLVDARYSASCGGHSEHNENIWGGEPDPSLRGHLDATPRGARALRHFDDVTDDNVDAFLRASEDAAYCGRTKYAKGRYRWTKTLDAAVVTRRIAEHYANLGEVVALEPIARGTSGRIKQLRVRGTRGTKVVVGDLHIRRLLGGLRSTLFTVRATGPKGAPTAFTFHGAGFGHGVGMCQTGAIGRADAGQTYEEILGHYYPGSRVHRLY